MPMDLEGQEVGLVVDDSRLNESCNYLSRLSLESVI